MHCHCLKRAKQNKKLTTKAKKQKTHNVDVHASKFSAYQIFDVLSIFNLLFQVNFNKYYIINDDKSTLNEN